MHKKAIIVDKEDKIIGYKDWKKIDWSKDRIRASRLWLEDLDGNVLLQKRGTEKDFNPGMYVFAVGGVNDKGETYEAALRRAAKKELGLHLFGLRNLGTVTLAEPVRRGFITYFKSVVPGKMPPIKSDPEEVFEVVWVSKKELKQLMANGPKLFVEDLLKAVLKFKLL